MPRSSPRAISRALAESIRLTLRGKTSAAAPESHPQTRAWMRDALTALAVVDSAIRDEKADAEKVLLHIEGRNVRMSTILAGVRFHLTDEYPSLLTSSSRYALLAIKATNLNDRYQVMRLEQVETLPDNVRATLHALATILGAQPTENP